VYYFQRLNKDTLSSKIGLIASIIAGLSVNIMFVVQLALYQTKIDINFSQMVKEDPEVIKSVMKLVNSVQLGLDIV